MGFRFKLLLAILSVVAVTTAGSLIVTQALLEQANERQFRVRVNEQLTYLPREQEARLGVVRQQASEFAALPAVFGALEERDGNKLFALAQKRLQPMLTDELRRLRDQIGTGAGNGIRLGPSNHRLGTGARKSDGVARTSSGRGQSKEGRRLPTAGYMVFLGLQGGILQPSGNEGFFGTAQRRSFRNKLKYLASDLADISDQQVAFLDVGTEKKPRLIEIIITPVDDPESGMRAGTFVLGFPFFDRGEKAISEVTDIRNGIWLNGKLHSRTISEEARMPLSKRLNEILRHPNSDHSQVISSTESILLSGVPYRIFAVPMTHRVGQSLAYKVGLYSWAEPAAMAADIRNQILMIGGGMGMLGVLISWLVSLGLFRPIRRLHRATLRLRDGNYDVRVPVRSSDEFGQLSEAFNMAAEELAQKDRYRDLLNKVADKEVAQRLLDGDVALGGETRRMTVLFCDIRKYTEITQTMAPEEIVIMLNEHMSAMTRVVHEHGGAVDKFVGDMIMATFGATGTDPDAARRAVACARHMIRERKVLNMMSGQEINMGIGVATGEMLAGFMGSEDRLNFTVIGQGANLASRLCGVAALMEVLMDEATSMSVDERGEMLPPLEIKGFAEPQAVFRLKPEEKSELAPPNPQEIPMIR
jgi:class 3 adenylate cyclase